MNIILLLFLIDFYYSHLLQIIKFFSFRFPSTISSSNSILYEISASYTYA